MVNPSTLSSHIISLILTMSSGNNSNNVDWTRVALPELEGKPTNSIQVQITKFDEQSRQRRDRLMKQAAEQEARRLAEEAAKKKAEEEAKRIAEEKRKAEEQAKKAAEEKAWADFKARRKAEAEVRAREKAESLAAGEAMRARLGQGAKPKVRGILILY